MKNIKPILLGLVILATGITSCQNTQKKEAQPELVKIWETDAVFNIPESVCYDPGEKVLYVSNVHGSPTDQDSNGFISKCSLEGKVIELQWATGLHAPKGMGIYDGKLYASDIDRVAQIDLATGEVLAFFDVPGATFLNDIAISKKGTVFISDMMDTKIYSIFNDTVELWLDDPVLTSPNGLFVEEDQLLIGCKKIVKAGLEDRVLEECLAGTGGIDGLEGTGDGRYLFSDWKGNVYLVDQSIQNLLDLTGEKKNAADIEFIPGEKLLLVPTFAANTVIAYILEN